MDGSIVMVVYTSFDSPKKEIATLDERMQSISLLKGIELIEKAIAVLKDRGRATDFLSADLEKIYQLRSSCAKKLQ